MRAERVDVGAIGRTQRSLVSAWLDLPVKRPVVLVLVVLIVATPAWLLADWLKNFALHPTDFIYIEEAIDARALRKHLFVPLNTHVVPLFRLYTYAVVQSTDRLEHLPRMLLGASYLGLVATMLLVGRLVSQETGRTGPALGAMACMGITAVVLPVVSHYAASQALWSGAAIVATLLATHAWRSRGGTWRLVPAAIGVLAAPAIWSGGLVAGPAAAAALWADGRPRCRRAAVAMIALSGVAALVILGLSRQYINEDAVVNEIHRELWPRPIQGLLNAIQAVAEATILNNLGSRRGNISIPGSSHPRHRRGPLVRQPRAHRAGDSAAGGRGGDCRLQRPACLLVSAATCPSAACGRWAGITRSLRSGPSSSQPAGGRLSAMGCPEPEAS